MVMASKLNNNNPRGWNFYLVTFLFWHIRPERLWKFDALDHMHSLEHITSYCCKKVSCVVLTCFSESVLGSLLAPNEAAGCCEKHEDGAQKFTYPRNKLIFLSLYLTDSRDFRWKISCLSWWLYCTFSKYHDSTVNTTWNKENHQKEISSSSCQPFAINL